MEADMTPDAKRFAIELRKLCERYDRFLPYIMAKLLEEEAEFWRDVDAEDDK